MSSPDNVVPFENLRRLRDLRRAASGHPVLREVPDLPVPPRAARLRDRLLVALVVLLALGLLTVIALVPPGWWRR